MRNPSTADLVADVLRAAKEYGIEMTPETALEIVEQDAVNNPPCSVCGVISCCEHDECGAEGVAGFHCSLKPGHEGKHSAHDNMPGSDTFGQVIETW